jgi:DNA-binding IclR family transcriptional regulator
MSKTERLFAVLERLTSDRPPPTHGELLREVDIQRSTLSDLLAELRQLGYVDVIDRRYVPGLELLTFVHRAARQPNLSAVIAPVLEDLAAETQETAIYVIEAGGYGSTPRYVVSIDQVESPNTIRYVGEIGVPYPIEETAAGRVFLACGVADPDQPDADAELEGRLEEIRRQGFAVVGEDERSTAIAAPVRDRNEQMLGVVSIVGPTNRLRGQEKKIGRRLLQRLASLGRSLG